MLEQTKKLQSKHEAFLWVLCYIIDVVVHRHVVPAIQESTHQINTPTNFLFNFEKYSLLASNTQYCCKMSTPAPYTGGHVLPATHML